MKKSVQGDLWNIQTASVIILSVTVVILVDRTDHSVSHSILRLTIREGETARSNNI